MSIKSLNKLHDRLLFNFLAYDQQNAQEIMDASNGFTIPGIVSVDFSTVEDAALKVAELKTVSPIVSIGLGGGGDVLNWRKVVDIALLSDPGHINQLFHTAVYAQGILDHAKVPQFINALVAPTGKQGFVKLASGAEILLDGFLEMAKSMNIQSIKVMPMNGIQHLDELIRIAKRASWHGIYGIEPAGGIHAGNVKEIMYALLKTNISFVMPHIFGNTIDPLTKRTLPGKVQEIVQIVS